MQSWLRLIRYKNLLIVFMTQLLVWYCLLYSRRDLIQLIEAQHYKGYMPGSYTSYITPLASFIYFLLLSGSTIFIAAAGYIINDYFDLKIDLINRPEKMILEKRIPMRTAIIAHSILNITGFLMAAFLAYCANHYQWLLVQLACTILLWFYSTHFKKQFITGNVVVALLTALTIVVLIIYAPGLRLNLYLTPAIVRINNTSTFINPLWMCIGFCVFAFMLTWMREIVKDMEDYKGDAAEGCITMPIKKGLQFSARFAQVLGAITISALAIIAYYFITDAYLVLGVYTIALIILPLIWWCIYITRRNTIEHYGYASKWLKIIMLSGIASLIVYHFTT